ncbi:uncharacterized protein Nmag_2636 [Natrialba magadii ATCC 43099]|nr:hypothetical protein [Natrialba magadii]ADD06195.1 uncharacterized protein Nmag_2636 [Natrialba magadii ATCC 43099]
MNHLVPTDDGDGDGDGDGNGDDTWRLPQHAHIVVYEREQGAGSEPSVVAENDSDSVSDSDETSDSDSRGLLTIYDCGAAQQPPSAQLLGTLESVDASAVVEPQPTGRIVKLREEAVLERQPADRYQIR